MKKDSTRNVIDWEAVERDYRAGIKTLRQLGDEYGCSHTAIKSKAKREDWTRNLQAKIQAKAEALVSKAEVSTEVSMETKLAERQVIEANAEMLATVIRGHRKDASRLRAVVTVLLDEVSAILSDRAVFEQIGEVCFEPNEAGFDKVNELYRKVIALPGQVGSVKTLAETLKILIELERKIFKLDALETDLEAVVRGATQGAVEGVGEVSKSVLAGLIEELRDDDTPA